MPGNAIPESVVREGLPEEVTAKWLSEGSESAQTGEEVPGGGNSKAWQWNSKECGWVVSEGKGGPAPRCPHGHTLTRDVTDGNPGGF